MQRKTLLGGIAVILILGAITTALYLNKKHTFHGSLIDPPSPAAEITLTDQNGQLFQLSSLRGKIVLIYFGYTHCQDECPLTMGHLKEMMNFLGDQSKDLQVVMVSTDPARDTAQAMKGFLGKFNPDFIGLIGTPDELAKAWKDYGVTVLDNGETHSNFIYLVDRSGNLRLTFLPDSAPEDEAADLRVFLAEK
jgi:protein SCO1/2